MMLSKSRAVKGAPAGAQRPRLARRLLPIPARVTSTSVPATTTKTSSSPQRAFLVDFALPRARARLLEPFATADAALASLVADPLLVEATTTTCGESSSKVAAARALAATVDAAVDAALSAAYESNDGDGDGNNDRATTTASHLFLQRCLYRVNRLSYVFYGLDLEATYGNERAPWLLALRGRIESVWQRWELVSLSAFQQQQQHAGEGDGDKNPLRLLDRYRALDAEAVERELLARMERDRWRDPSSSSSSSSSPSSSPDLDALRNRLNANGFAHLLAAQAHDGLTEASRQSRVCAGTGHEAASACFRILSDEYGGGRLRNKHSTFYAAAMRACGVLPLGVEGDEGKDGKDAAFDDAPQQQGRQQDQQQQQQQQQPLASSPPLSPAEAWIDLAPWQLLAAANHNFLLAERRRHLLRYMGALSAFELTGPLAYDAYAAAADRLSPTGDGALGGYFRLHVAEDAKHGPQALTGVALPLARLYKDKAWELLLGYDQEGFIAQRATAALRSDIEACGGLG